MVKVVFESFRTFATFQTFRHPQEAIHDHHLDEEVAQAASEYFSRNHQLTADFINEVL